MAKPHFILDPLVVGTNTHDGASQLQVVGQAKIGTTSGILKTTNGVVSQAVAGTDYEAANSNIQNHISSSSNPHSVTATQIGLGNVTNESKATMFTNPTFTGTVSGVTATHVGLGNVTNESKATMFTSPVFTGTVTLGTSEAGVVTPTTFAGYAAGNAYTVLRNTANDIEYFCGAATTEVLMGSATNHTVKIRANNTDIVAISSTGLAVTGNISSTASGGVPAPIVSVDSAGGNITAAVETHYVLTHGSATNVNLPVGGTIGAQIWVTVANGLLTNTITPNAADKIQGGANGEAITLNVNGASVQLRWIDGTNDWRII